MVAHRIALSLIILIAGSAAATQFLAHVFDGQPALGAPLSIGDWRLYPPWSLVVWNRAWADEYPRPFAIARLIGASSLIGAVLVAAVPQARPGGAKPFGKDSWARFEDARAASLFAAQGTVLGKLDGELLAFDGPEHQLLIGRRARGRGAAMSCRRCSPGRARRSYST